MRTRSVLAFAAGLTLLTSCRGLKEALTAHVDVAARAADTELSVTRLSDLLGNARVPVPVTRESSRIIANLWVDYQLVAQAAAKGDSLNDPKTMDAALAPITNNMKLRRFMDSVSASFPKDSGTEAAYNSGANDIFAARHILFGYPPNATPAQRDSVHQRALAIRPQINAGNFAAMAGRYSTEPGAGARGGSLGVFRRDQMVKEFGDAVAAIRPGEVSAPIETQFGWHIVQRLPWDAARAQYAAMFTQASQARAESIYVAHLDSAAQVEVKKNAPAKAKEAASEPGRHRRDNDVLAEYKGGNLTVAEFLVWMEGFPPNARVSEQMQQAPDSAISQFLRGMTRNQIMLDRADSAHVTITAEERTALYHEFSSMVTTIWDALGVSPALLADSGKSAEERGRVAAARVDAYMDRVLSGQAQPVGVPEPLESVLQSKYEWTINSAGLDRATERARPLRLAADSTRARTQPQSEVPLPGAPPSGQQQQPQPQQPQPAPARP